MTTSLKYAAVILYVLISISDLSAQIDTVRIKAKLESLRAAAYSDDGKNSSAAIAFIRYNYEVKPYTALKHVDHFLPKFESDKGIYSYLLNLKGLILRRTKNFDEAAEVYKKAVIIKRELKDYQGLSEILINYAYLKLVEPDYSGAGEFLIEVSSYMEFIKDTRIEADLYNAQAILDFILKRYESCRSNSNKALELSQKIDYLYGMADANEHLGILELTLKNHAKAGDFFDRVIKFRISTDDLAGVAGNYDNKALIASRNEDYESALKYAFMALDIREFCSPGEGAATSFTIIGSNYTKMGKNEEGLRYLYKALERRIVYNDKRGLISTLRQLSEAYERIGDLKQALNYYRQFKAESDSLQIEKNARAIEEYKHRFNLQQKDIQLKALQAENQFKGYLTLGFGVLVIIAISIIVFVNKNNKKIHSLNKQLEEKNRLVEQNAENLKQSNEQLVKLNKEKDVLFSVVSHDIRNPIMAFLGYSSLIEDDLEVLEKSEIKSLLRKMNNAAVNLNNLVENVLNWSLLNLEKLSIQHDYFDINKEIKKVNYMLAGIAEVKDINIEIPPEEHVQVFADRNVTNLILRNIVTNAIKFSHPGSRISIHTELVNSHAAVHVDDSGIGIADEILEEIRKGYVKSTSGTGNEKGTGFGLSLCFDLAKKQGGNIEINSEVNKGTKVKIILPSYPRN